MKKTIALVLCLLMVVSLVACGGQATADESSASTEQTETISTSEETKEETEQSEESKENVENSTSEIADYITAAMEASYHLTGSDTFVARDGSIISVGSPQYDYFPVYAKIPNLKKLAVSGSEAAVFALTVEGDLYFYEHKIAENVKDIVYATNNVNEDGIYITDSGIFSLAKTSPQMVPDSLRNMFPNNYTEIGEWIVSQFDWAIDFENFAIERNMQGRTPFSLENDLQDFVVVDSEGNVFLDVDDEIYETMECLEWENMVLVDIAKHMNPQSAPGEEAETITVAGLQKDGTVMACGTYAEEVRAWENLAYLSLSDGMIVGLTKEGTLKIAGQYADALRSIIDDWSNIVTVEVGNASYQDGLVTAMDTDGNFYYAELENGMAGNSGMVSPESGSLTLECYKYTSDGGCYVTDDGAWVCVN